MSGYRKITASPAGKNNPDGMRLKFTYDEERDCFVCRFRLGKRYTGPPGHCHGGIIATILDEAMGKVNKLRHVIALTSEITVNYLKPVPLNKPLRVESRELRVNGRKHINMAEILNREGRSAGTRPGIVHRDRPQADVCEVRGSVRSVERRQPFGDRAGHVPSKTNPPRVCKEHEEKP